MVKISLVLCIGLLGYNAAHAQSIKSRHVDSAAGIIIVETALDTVAFGKELCYVSVSILNEDSTNNYALNFYFKTPQSFFQTRKDLVQIHYDDGTVYEDSVYTDGRFYTEGDIAFILLPTKASVLNKMFKNPVTAVCIETANWNHEFKIEDPFKKSFLHLVDNVSSINVYDQNGIYWSELSNFRFPEN